MIEIPSVAQARARFYEIALLATVSGEEIRVRTKTGVLVIRALEEPADSKGGAEAPVSESRRR